MTLLPLGGYAPCTWNNGYERYRVMANDLNQPMVYQIRIKGHLDRRWTEWFGNVTITLEDDGETLLTCPVADQAALYELLRKVRDLECVSKPCRRGGVASQVRTVFGKYCPISGVLVSVRAPQAAVLKCALRTRFNHDGFCYGHKAHRKTPRVCPLHRLRQPF